MTRPANPDMRFAIIDTRKVDPALLMVPIDFRLPLSAQALAAANVYDRIGAPVSIWDTGVSPSVSNGLLFRDTDLRFGRFQNRAGGPWRLYGRSAVVGGGFPGKNSANLRVQYPGETTPLYMGGIWYYTPDSGSSSTVRLQTSATGSETDAWNYPEGNARTVAQRLRLVYNSGSDTVVTALPKSSGVPDIYGLYTADEYSALTPVRPSARPSLRTDAALRDHRHGSRRSGRSHVPLGLCYDSVRQGRAPAQQGRIDMPVSLGGLSRVMQKEIDLVDDTLKIALYSSSATITRTTASYTGLANEITGTGYTAGGATLSNVTIATDSTGNRVWLDCDDVVWDNATFTARYAIVYDDTVATKPIIAYYDFGSNQSPSASRFTVQPGSTSATAFFSIESE